MKTKRWLLVCLVGGLGCGGDDAPMGNTDALPKRGDRETDPTIVSATAQCFRGTDVEIAASDPMGPANLGTCSVTIGTLTDQSSFASDGTCYVTVGNAGCMSGPTRMSIIVSNKTGGVTTANTTVNVTPATIPPDAPGAR